MDVPADLVFLRHRLQVAKRREILQGKTHGIEYRDLFIALASLDVALHNPEKLDDGRVSLQLLNIAFNPRLRFKFHDDPGVAQDVGVQFGLAWQSPPTALICMPGSIISGVRIVA